MSLDALVRDGTVTLIAIAALGLELIAIVGLALWRGNRPSGSFIANWLSGLFLILALRAALVGQGSGPIALFLGAAGLAHLGDIIVRQRRSDV